MPEKDFDKLNLVSKFSPCPPPSLFDPLHLTLRIWPFAFDPSLFDSLHLTLCHLTLRHSTLTEQTANSTVTKCWLRLCSLKFRCLFIFQGDIFLLRLGGGNSSWWSHFALKVQTILIKHGLSFYYGVTTPVILFGNSIPLFCGYNTSSTHVIRSEGSLYIIFKGYRLFVQNFRVNN